MAMTISFPAASMFDTRIPATSGCLADTES
jgi:hypothetical protein